ncbi:MAG TPA: hypothetical protein VKI45_10745 [Allosphingosinicella sp.]|nr:hypothetical protein [Allosphingosinicella sp.]
MLRNAIVGLFGIVFLLCLWGAAQGNAPWGAPIVFGVLLALLVFERQRYSAHAAEGSREPMTPTRERFIDPESGRPVQVWSNARGERRYVEEPPGRS